MREYKGVIAFWLLIAVAALIGLSWLFPEYGEICSPQNNNQSQQRDCATYGMSGYALLNSLTWLQNYNGAITALATAAIFCLTVTLARVGRNQVSDSRVTQRAYVGMSHVTDAGNPGLNPANQKVTIQVRNAGTTPAKVVGVRLGYIMVGPNEPPPVIPPYDTTDDHLGAQAFLHTNDFFYLRQGLSIPNAEWGEITSGQKTLYVIGLVEYVDMFGVWHRAGYARRYRRNRPTNNLAFVSEGAYSYDIVISESNRLTGKQK